MDNFRALEGTPSSSWTCVSARMLNDARRYWKSAPSRLQPRVAAIGTVRFGLALEVSPRTDRRDHSGDQDSSSRDIRSVNPRGTKKRDGAWPPKHDSSCAGASGSRGNRALDRLFRAQWGVGGRNHTNSLSSPRSSETWTRAVFPLHGRQVFG